MGPQAPPPPSAKGVRMERATRQATLQFDAAIGPEQTEEVRGRCRELLAQLLGSIVLAERKRREDGDARQAPTPASREDCLRLREAVDAHAATAQPRESTPPVRPCGASPSARLPRGLRDRRGSRALGLGLAGPAGLRTSAGLCL